MGFVDRPHLVWWRRLLFQVHLWTGIILALYVVVISLSGSGVVFADQIAHGDSLARPSDSTVRPLSLAALAGIARSYEKSELRADAMTEC